MAHNVGIETGNENPEFESLFRNLRLVSKNIENLKSEKFNEEDKNSFNVENFINEKIYEIDHCFKISRRFIDDENKNLVMSKILEIEKILSDYNAVLKDNNFLFNFSFKKEINNIVDELTSIIRGDVDNKLTEYANYYEKIEPLINIENNLLKLETLFIQTDDGSDNLEINKTLNNIRIINSFFKNREKYKFFIILPLDYLKKFADKTETFLGFFSDRGSQDSIELIHAFYDVLNAMSFVGPRNSWSNDYFWGATYKYQQSKEINEKSKEISELSKKLTSKIKEIDNLKELENLIIEGYESSLGESFSLMDKVKNDIRSELSLAKNYVTQLEKEKNAVLQYSEDVKNTDAVKVYSKLYSQEILIATWFRFFTLLIFGIFSIISLICLIALFLFPENNYIVKNLINTDKILGKIPFIITFFIFGFYLAKEGEKHRRIANQAKQTEGELIALASYTNGWDSKEIRDLKAKLADKYFGKNLYETEKSLPPDGDMVKSLIEQTKVTTDLIKTLKGTIAPSTSSQDSGKNKSGTDQNN
ncbi:hypothetical protein [Acinetobacter sp. ANC 3813]|uniref:hypothetical protein n=1 Tax=Acinetobacter sp. ANC 3813 TaxID=1977873 RepID=UPI000A35AE58|nr:hypothetical protein [Acinetobacter sp. ANC 3813]OTG87375.1 hypothetical protein B9T34_16815 [Acinetobacter sp. ANC 3813]